MQQNIYVASGALREIPGPCVEPPESLKSGDDLFLSGSAGNAFNAGLYKGYF